MVCVWLPTIILNPPERSDKSALIEFFGELVPHMIYQIAVEGVSGRMELVIVDQRTGEWFERVEITGKNMPGK